MSIKFRHKPHKFSFASTSYFLRCERLEDRLAFSTSNALSCLEIAASPVTDPTGSETTSTVKIGIVEDQETTPLPCDLENPVDFEPDLGYDDQHLAEDDQIVWYMPWFGDESDEFANESDDFWDLYCDDTGEILWALPLTVEPCPTNEEPYYPTYQPFGWMIDTADFPDDMTFDDVALWDDKIAEFAVYSYRGPVRLPLWSFTMRTAFALSHPTVTSTTVANTLDSGTSTMQLGSPPVMPFWLAFAPESTGLQLYFPSVISTSDSTEEKEQPFPVELM